MTVFSDLAALSSAEIYLKIDAQALERDTKAVRNFRLTTAPILVSRATDTPANTFYHNVVVKGCRSRRSLTVDSNGLPGKTFTGASEPSRCELLIDNSTGAMPDWADLDWNAQPINLEVGGPLRADGTPFLFSEFVPFFTGQVDDIHRVSDNTISISIEGRLALCRQPVVEAFYRGFGGSLDLVAPDALASKSPVTLTAPITIEAIGKIGALPTTDGSWIGIGDAFRLRVRPSGIVTLETTGAVLNDTSLTVTAGQDLYLSATLDTALGVQVRGGTSAEDIAVVLSTTVGSVDLTSKTIELGRIGGLDAGETWAAQIYEGRVWSTVRTEDEQLDNADQPLPSPLTQSGLTEVFKFHQLAGITALGSRGTHDLTLSDGAAFTPSLTGDDPEVLGSSIQGQSKPRGWGPQFNVAVPVVDEKSQVVQWSDTPSVDIRRLKSDGAFLVPDERLTAAALGDFSFTDVGGNFIDLKSGLGFDLRRFVPGQTQPLLLGQKFVVELAIGFNGTYRIGTAAFLSGAPSGLDEGISDDFLRMVVVDENGDPIVGFPTGDLPAGAVIRTEDNAIQYTFDLPTSTATTVEPQSGQLTADPVGTFGATATVVQVAEDILGETVENLLTFNPAGVGAFIRTGEGSREDEESGAKICELLSALMRTVLGWYVETRTGGIRLGSYVAPAGPAVASIIGSEATLLGSPPQPIGRIFKIREAESQLPTWRTRVGYDRTWHVHEAGSVVGSVTSARRERLTTRFQQVLRTLGAVRRQYPTAEPMELPLETHLANRVDAETLSTRLKALIGEKRRWYDVSVAGLGLLTLDVGQVVFLEHPDPDLGLVGGRLAFVTSLAEDTGTDVVELEMYT
jgi:hypothetical protein